MAQGCGGAPPLPVTRKALMDAQLSFKLEPFEPPAPKRVSETSKEAYAELQPTLTKKERNVLSELTEFVALTSRHPTAYELFNFMHGRGKAKDLNDVRPRLSEMADPEKGKRFAEKIGKRRCEVSRKNAWTWKVTERGRFFLSQESK